MRATTSGGEPAPEGTTMRMALAGWAWAPDTAASMLKANSRPGATRGNRRAFM
jgi:hypothetical protein